MTARVQQFATVDSCGTFVCGAVANCFLTLGHPGAKIFTGLSIGGLSNVSISGGTITTASMSIQSSNLIVKNSNEFIEAYGDDFQPNVIQHLFEYIKTGKQPPLESFTTDQRNQFEDAKSFFWVGI